MAGYLEKMTAGLLLDLVTVSAFEVNGTRLLVPQRVDPLQRVAEDYTPLARSGRADALPTEGSAAFAERISVCPPDVQEDHHRLLRWARDLEHQGIARLWTTVGLTQDVLQVRVPGEQVGLVTVWRGGTGPALSLWETVFERRAPTTLPLVKAALAGGSMSKSVRDPSDDLLARLTDAYREAAAVS